MKKLTLIIAAFLSFNATAKNEYISTEELKAFVESGQVDSLLRPKYIFESSLEQIEVLSAVREVLKASNEEQLMMIEIIDMRINNDIMSILLSYNSGMLNKTLHKNSNYVRRVIKSIEDSRLLVASKVDPTPLENLKILLEAADI